MAFALDLEALDVAQSTDVEVRTELLSDSFSRESNYGSASFQPVVMQKLRALQLLLHEGRTIFFLDTVLTAQRLSACACACACAYARVLPTACRPRP